MDNRLDPFAASDQRGGSASEGPAPGRRTLTQSLPAVQRRATPTAEPGPAAAPARAQASVGDDPFALHLPAAPRGGAMPEGVQAQMERSFGFDLSPVKVHHDGAADAMGAHAFARGSDLHFGAGEFAPETPGGLHLLAHELAHVTQQALGRAPAGTHARLADLMVDDPLEDEADAMADRAVRGEPAWAGAGDGPLRALPLFGAVPAFAKLRVKRDWIVAARTITKRVVENGGDVKIAAILKRWAKDKKTNGRLFAGWGEAIEAARASMGGRGPRRDPQEDDDEELSSSDESSDESSDSETDSEHDDDGGPPDDDDDDGGGGGGGGGRSRLQWLLLVLFLLLLIVGGVGVGMLAMGMSRYEVRPGMQDTAMTARRPLEPLMRINPQELSTLATHEVTRSLQSQLGALPVDEVLDGNPDIEEAFPDATRLRNIERELEQIAPQLQALAPALLQLQPLLEEVGPNDLDNPANTGVYHEHIFLGPQPTTSDARDNPLTTAPQVSPVHPPDLGFFHDDVHPDRPEMMSSYTAPQHHYDRALMERAALAVARDYEHYRGITHNCQDYVDAVVTAYKDLGGREVVPTRRAQVTLAITDLIIDYAGSVIDTAVEGALGEKLASLRAEDGGSQCAQAVATHLGISAKTFGKGVDAVLDQTVPLGSVGRIKLRTALCGPTGDIWIDSGMARLGQLLDQPVDLPEEGPSTVRQAMCTPKNQGGDNALKGTLFELVRIQGGAEIVSQLPAFIKDEPLASRKLTTEVAKKVADRLYDMLNLKGLCG